jgi:sulfoquinovose isomerase
MPAIPMESTAHQHWLRNEELRLVEFSRHVVRTDGLAAWLDADGVPDASQPALTYVTARMAHVNMLAAMRGVPGARDRGESLLQGLAGPARDATNGGWRESDADDGTADKSAYVHAFVVLAASTGALAGSPTAPALLTDALEAVDRWFWEPTPGMFADTARADWSERRDYRGINANMHLVEAMLAASDATGDPQWASRAVQVCRFVVEHAAANDWRIPEHYDADWTPKLEYNADQPGDQFKPYGATIGHAFEWARLLVTAAPLAGESGAAFVDAAEHLYAHAVADGWARNGHPGFVYTTDWQGAPVVSDRLHWVVTEAIGAAVALGHVSDDPRYAREYMTLWDFADTFHIDREHGSWLHQLTPENEPDGSIWSGKPDLYHAYQAALIGQLPPATSFARAVLTA